MMKATYCAALSNILINLNMKLLLDENQVGVSVPDGDSSIYGVTRIGNTADREVREMEGLEQKSGGAAIGFPNVKSCQGVTVVMNNGVMIGTHVPDAGSETLLLDKMREVIDANGGPESISQMYVAYDSTRRGDNNGMDVAGKAEHLGFSGKAKYVDTSRLDLRGDGAYVQITSLGREDGKCLVEAKREAKMTYTATPMKLTDDQGRSRPVSVKDTAQLAVGATKMHKVEGKSMRV